MEEAAIEQEFQDRDSDSDKEYDLEQVSQVVVPYLCVLSLRTNHLASSPVSVIVPAQLLYGQVDT